jgi:peptidoglycan/LPS O-acetylase OafA/YrhL
MKPYTQLEQSADLVPPTRLPYMRGLDGLRAIAVMAVVFYHADFTWATGGFLGVEVFFVISGYLITSLLLVEWLRAGTIDLKNFWLRRARRLLPAVFLLLAVVSAMAILFYRDTLNRMFGDVVAAITYVTNWFFIFRQDSYFEAFGRPPVLRHLWSLGVEEQFYVLWPLIFTFGLAMVGKGTQKRTLKRFGMLVLSGVVASAALMYFLYTPFEDPSRAYYGTDTRATGILIGVLLALVWMPWKLPSKITRRQGISINAIGISAIGILVYILGTLSEFAPFLYRGGFVVTSLATATAIAATVHPGASLGRILDTPVMKWIGTRSYGIYLWHWPIFMITRPGFDIPWTVAPTFVFRLALTFVVTELSYRYVESPIRNDGFRAWMTGIRQKIGIDSVQKATAFALSLVAVIVFIGAGLVQGAVTRPTSLVASPSDSGATQIGVSLADDRAVAPPEDGSNAQTPSTTQPTQDAAGTVESTATSTTIASASTSTPVTTLPPAPLPSVTMIGDSVMLGAEQELIETLPNDLNVDAIVSRQFKHAGDVAAELRADGQLGDVVVLHLGTNGAFNSEAFDEVMSELQDRDRVIVVNAKVPRRWEALVNKAIEEGSERWPNVEVIDWNTYGNARPELFSKDQVHLNVDGKGAYARLLDRVINGR